MDNTPLSSGTPRGRVRGTGEVTYDTAPYLIAIVYRTAFGVGVIATIARGDLGPLWYPVVLLVVAWPSAWVGGILHRSQTR